MLLALSLNKVKDSTLNIQQHVFAFLSTKSGSTLNIQVFNNTFLPFSLNKVCRHVFAFLTLPFPIPNQVKSQRERTRNRDAIFRYKMSELEEGDGIASVHEDISSTPLRRYVTVVGDKKLRKWTCNFGCKREPYTGTYSRIRAHFIGLTPGQKSQGINLCCKVSKEERENMKKEEEESRRIFGNARAKAALPTLPIITPSCKDLPPGAQHIGSMIQNLKRDETDSVVARFFYGCGIPFNVARSPHWADVVTAINKAKPGYKAPSSEKIRTTLLDKERTKIENALMPIKEQWPTFGVSIVSDGWSNCKNQPLINVIAISGGRPIFLNAVDCSGDEKAGQYIAGILFKAIENVGTYNVVQILTDNASACKAAGDIIQARFPHILWSGCMAHTLSLLMKDIAHSHSPTLSFIDHCYSKAKGVVNYIRTHSFVLHIFRTFSSLEVIQVKKTRFGHHYVVLDRIYRVKNALISMVLDEEWETIRKGTSKSKLEHDQVKKVILDDEFWKDVKFILSFTKLIWNMIRFCDTDKSVVGEVYQRMEDMLGSLEEALPDYGMYLEIEALVMARWERMNLPLHTLAYVMTPFYYSQSWLQGRGPCGKARVKPHANLFVQATYLNVLDRLIRDQREAPLIRQQLSDFTSDRGVFARPQAIDDRKMMSAISWWNLYGVAAPELYHLAIKVLSQGVNSSCAERAWNVFNFVHSVRRNRLNADRAESLVFVHYNNRLLTRYREDYEKSYKDWDNFAYDDVLDNDLEAVERRELSILYTDDGNASTSLLNIGTSTTIEDASRAKKQRIG